MSSESVTPPPGAAPAAAAHDGHGAHAEPDYIKIFWWLFGLTAVEVAASYLPVNKWLMGFVLVSLAFFKAGLVAAFYMHLKFEGKLLYLVCCVPIVLVCVLTLGMVPDIANRVVATSKAAGAAQAPGGTPASPAAGH